MTDREIISCLRFWKDQQLAFWMNAAFLPVAAIFLWGLESVRVAVAWSVGAMAYAAYVLVRGWTPWRMPVYQIYGGKAFDAGQASPIQMAVYEFLHAPGNRKVGAAITATAAVTPWLFFGASRLLGLRHFGYGVGGIPVWCFLVIGMADGIRASTLAMKYWITQTTRHWAELAGQAVV